MTALQQPGPRRRPAFGGYARGEEKRIRIIEAALRRFGEEGFERASTRQIAQDAGVNPPALQYYFDSKRGLHLACVEYLGQCFSLAMRDAYLRSEHATQAAAPDALCDIIDAMADYLFETAEADGWSRFIARGQSEEGDDPSYRMLRNTVVGELHGHCSRLVGLITGRPATDIHTRLRTSVILGQLTAFHLGRSITIEQLGWPDLRGPRLRMLKAVLRDQTRAALQASALP